MYAKKAQVHFMNIYMVYIYLMNGVDWHLFIVLKGGDGAG